MSKSVFHSLVRRYLGGTGIAALAFIMASLPAKALADPATVAVVVQATSFLLNATRPSYDPGGAMQRAQLQAVLQIHNRLGNVETGISLILERIELLAQEMKLTIRQELDQDAVDNLHAAMKSIDQLIEDGVNANDNVIAQERSHLVRVRNTILEKNDFNVVAMMSAFAYEAQLCQAITCLGWGPSLSSYRERFSSMLNPERQESLAALYGAGLNALAADGEAIMEHLSGKKAPLEGGTYQWFKRTKGEIRHGKELVVRGHHPHCHTVGGQRHFADGRINTGGVDAPDGSGCMASWRGIFPLYSIHHTRQLTVEPVEGASFGAQRLKLSAGSEKVDDAIAWESASSEEKKRWRESIIISQKEFDAVGVAKERGEKHQALEGLVDRYNDRTDHLVELATVLNILSVTLALAQGRVSKVVEILRRGFRAG